MGYFFIGGYVVVIGLRDGLTQSFCIRRGLLDHPASVYLVTLQFTLGDEGGTCVMTSVCLLHLEQWALFLSRIQSSQLSKVKSLTSSPMYLSHLLPRDLHESQNSSSTTGARGLQESCWALTGLHLIVLQLASAQVQGPDVKALKCFTPLPLPAGVIFDFCPGAWSQSSQFSTAMLA